MLSHLRPDWEALTDKEQWIIWKTYWELRGKEPPKPKPYFNGGQLFDLFTSARVTQTSAIAGLWYDDAYRPLIAKTLGVK